MPFKPGSDPLAPFLYYLPPGMTGVSSYMDVFMILAEMYNFPSVDPGVTGAVFIPQGPSGPTVAVSVGPTAVTGPTGAIAIGP
jgi:hypothetical protein